LVEALLLDNGYLTDVRTAAAGAIAARHLARADAEVVAIIGAGMQARLQLQALALVRPVSAARIWARDGARASALANEMTARLNIPVTAEASVAGAVRGADIVVTTTPAEVPLITDEMIRDGQHITAMGSDAEHKTEIAPSLVARAIYVADRLTQTRRLGELHHAIAAGLVDATAQFPELGQIIAGQSAGRSRPEQITLADLTGTGIQDTAIAALAVSRARSAGAGQKFNV
jgi:ornithine cyclodeaminase